MRRNVQAGFTLLELLVVLAIAGLLVSIAAPFTVRIIEDAALRADVRELSTDLRGLRQSAIDRQETVTATALAKNARPWLIAGTGRRVQFRVAGPAHTIAFFPDGTSSGGTLYLREGTRSLSVHVAWPTGAVTSEPPR
jgi:general secretion pathway protein H